MTTVPPLPDSAPDAPVPLPAFADVEAAAARIAGVTLETPLLNQPLADAKLGLRLWIKAESLQRGGAFKLRGAWNRLAQLTPKQARAGVVAFSSGNHAQGVALAAQRLGMPAAIVMPADAPAPKIAATRAYGAEIIFYDRASEDREAIARHHAARRGAVLVPSYDDPDIIAGQGTAALELFAQGAAAGVRFDRLLVPAGGGGLVAGCALVRDARSPDTQIHAVEPASHDDHRRSLEAGAILANSGSPPSLCDALLSPAPGTLTFAINRDRLAGGLVIDDAQALAAMRFAATFYGLVLEPGGAAALAVVLADRERFAGETVAVIASGGNVDPALLARALGG
jgi:threonine dehydratase